MKRFLSLCTMNFILFLSLSTAFAANEAWYKTEWGMTESQVAAALDGQLRKVASEKRGNNTITHIAAPVKMDEHDFTVSLDITSSLSFVMLECKGSGSYGAFLSALSMFKKKYGLPASGPVKSGDSYYRAEKVEWLTDTSLIVLIYDSMVIPGKSSQSARVLYSPRKVLGTDKI